MLEDAARILDAVGVIIWCWDFDASALTPSCATGYSAAVLERSARVRRDADNAIAAAFRSAETRTVHGGVGATSAVVVPLLVPGGCAGVLAVELRDGGERRESVRALAAILAAQLARLFGPIRLVEALRPGSGQAVSA